MRLPWLEPARQHLLQAQRAGRLPGALLVHEDPGAGGGLLAVGFAQMLMCKSRQPQGTACGTCQGCLRVERGEHPDFKELVPDPELKSGQISVDQIRELGGLLSMSSYEGGASLVTIRPAEAMTRAAANALLKTLEEPRPGAHLLLVTTQPSRLPATVRSRCLLLRAPAPTREEALDWLVAQRPANPGDWEAALDVLGVAPLQALQADPGAMRALREECVELLRMAASGRLDVIRTADRWAKDELPLRLSAIENCLTRCVLGAGEGNRARPEMRSGTHLSGALPDINIGIALRLLDELRELRLQVTSSLNKPLAMERQLWRLGGTLAG